MNDAYRKEELKTHIQKVARGIFLQKGFAETRIVDIAREANISPSTIYLYFEGKKQLFRSLDIPQASEVHPEYDRRRAEIARAALHVFGQKGFETTSMDDIARAVGCSKAALYQYCASKEDLFLQVIHLYTHATPSQETIESANCADWRQGLYNVARSYMAISHDADRASFMGSVIRDSHNFPALGAAYYEISFCTARRNIVNTLSAVQQAGGIRAEVDLFFAVTSFLSALTCYAIFSETIVGIPNDVKEEPFLRATVDNFVRGIESGQA